MLMSSVLGRSGLSLMLSIIMLPIHLCALLSLYIFVVSGHLLIGLSTLSPPATLYLGITNKAGRQGIEVY
jgi:hypothetical protein